MVYYIKGDMIKSVTFIGMHFARNRPIQSAQLINLVRYFREADALEDFLFS